MFINQLLQIYIYEDHFADNHLDQTEITYMTTCY